jgi:uncharacterized membrane protein SirB2
VTALSLYPLVRGVHLATVAVTVTLFALRGVWMLRASPRLGRRWARVVPHANDTLLLASGIALAGITGQAPWDQPWLAAKLAGLAAYIGLGLVALRFGPTRRLRGGAWMAALAAVAYIVAVGLTRRPLPWA